MASTRVPRETPQELERLVAEATLESLVSESGRGANKKIDYEVGPRLYVVYDHNATVYRGPHADEALDAYNASWRQGARN